MRKLFIFLFCVIALTGTFRLSAASVTIDGITYETEANNEAYVSSATKSITNASILASIDIDGTTY